MPTLMLYADSDTAPGHLASHGEEALSSCLLAVSDYLGVANRCAATCVRIGLRDAQHACCHSGGTDSWEMREGKLCAVQGTDRLKDLELHVLENCAHWVQQDKPEEVHKLMRGFLKHTEPAVAA